MSRLALPPLYAIVDPLDTGRDPGGSRRRAARRRRPPAAAPPEGPPARGELLAAARAHPAARRARAGALLPGERPPGRGARRRTPTASTSARTTCRSRPRAQCSVPAPLIGVSTHDVEQARAAAAAGADYLGVGPDLHDHQQGGRPPARGLELVRAVRAAVTLPLVAIGGITPDTRRAVRAAGADAVAMIGALVRAPDVAAAVRHTLARLGGA